MEVQIKLKDGRIIDLDGFATTDLTVFEPKQEEFKDYYICDCEKNYGKTCKHPDKYRSRGCK